MTYIAPTSSGSSGYTGSVFSLHKCNAPTDKNTWRNQQTGAEAKGKVLSNYYMDPVYEITGYSATDYTHYYNHLLAPNKKVLIRYQYLPKVLDTRSTAWVDISFGFSSGGGSSAYFDKTSSYGWADATVHYKNVTRGGYDNFSYASIGETVISHSESGDRLIAVHFKSSGDYYNAHGSWGYSITGDTGHSWFKIIELE